MIFLIITDFADHLLTNHFFKKTLCTNGFRLIEPKYGDTTKARFISGI